MKILIAEDEPDIAGSLEKSFHAEGHEAIVAKNGEETLENLAHQQFDALLLDWRMPKLSGIEVCKRIREQRSNIPIILLTALTDISNKIDALNLGADDYITKPFSFEEVLARVKAVVRRAQTAIDTLSFDQHELNLMTRILHTPNGELRLPDREFELLKYFITNRNSIISKDQLATEVWQLPFYPTTNFVEVTVKNLRKKLEELSEKKFIKTIYGEGYIFIAE